MGWNVERCRNTGAKIQAYGVCSFAWQHIDNNINTWLWSDLQCLPYINYGGRHKRMLYGLISWSTLSYTCQKCHPAPVAWHLSETCETCHLKSCWCPVGCYVLSSRKITTLDIHVSSDATAPCAPCSVVDLSVAFEILRLYSQQIPGKKNMSRSSLHWNIVKNMTIDNRNFDVSVTCSVRFGN
jgi:hypothetical protein